MNRYICYCSAVLVSLFGSIGIVNADSLNVRNVGTFQFPSTGWNVTVANNYAYIAADSTGLRILDVSNPAVPVEVGKCRTSGLAEHVFINNNLAYVACLDSNGLQIIDVSDPHHPLSLGWCHTTNGLANTFVCDTLAYVAAWDGDLRIINVSDPAQPKEVGQCSIVGWSWWCVVSGSYAYVASDELGLTIINVSNPMAPFVISTSNTGAAFAVAILGNHVYTACGNNGLKIIDVSDLQAPVLVGSYDTPGFAMCVEVSGTMVYLGAGSGGLQIIDVSSPSNPALAGYYSSSDYMNGITVNNGYIFTTGYVNSFQIYQYYGPNGVESESQNNSNISSPKISLKCLPNPFYNQLQAAFNLENEAEVKLEMFNMIGQKISANNYGKMSAGRHQIDYRIDNISDTKMPNGVYLVRLTADAITAMTKVIKFN